jgi:hypothetical protein
MSAGAHEEFGGRAASAPSADAARVFGLAAFTEA